jgi:hypothetical protein
MKLMSDALAAFASGENNRSCVPSLPGVVIAKAISNFELLQRSTRARTPNSISGAE